MDDLERRELTALLEQADRLEAELRALDDEHAADQTHIAELERRLAD